MILLVIRAKIGPKNFQAVQFQYVREKFTLGSEAF